MFPVLFSIGKFSISSFGVLIILGFLTGLFTVWRLARAWDLDEEKTLDLTLLTFIGGLIGARIYFALDHLSIFAQMPLRIILITKYPGFSFWGGFLGGWLTLFYFVKRFKMDFWSLADIASVGFLGGVIFADLGCFFGGCNAGIPSKAFFAVNMVGQLGKRWPVQALEAILLTWVLFKLWSEATHFHQRGKIVGKTLILIGIIKLLMAPLEQIQFQNIIFNTIIGILGVTIFYKATKRNIVSDLRNLPVNFVKLFTDANVQAGVFKSLDKYWYNQKASIQWKFRNLKKILRRKNVKFS